MDRQKIFKQMTNNINKMEQKKNINNNIEMDVEEFFKQIEKDNDNKCLYRHINIRYNKKGIKIPSGEKNDLTIDEIKKNRGNTNYNTLSLYVKHIPDLYVIDYDTNDCKEDLLFFAMMEEKVAYTKTLKGYHFYVKIKNIGKYSQQQKIFKNGLDVDLIKKNNIWETKERIVKGTIKEYEWDELKNFFDIEKMNFENSPPVSPPTSDEDENNNENEDDFMELQVQPKQYNVSELQDILDILGDDCYEYDTFIKVGMALQNITDADDIGKGLYIDWAKKDEGNFDLDFINKNWDYWNKQQKEKKLGITYLRQLKEKYQPKSLKSLQSIYKYNLTDSKTGQGRGKAKQAMLREMNNRLMYIKKTSNFVVPTIDTIINYDDEGMMINTKQKDTYEVKAIKDVKLHFQKENFEYSFTDEDGNFKTLRINPLNEWLSWIDRNEKEKIDFDPRNIDNPYIFNIWKGYSITKEMCEDYNEEDAEPVLNHIKEIWCSGDEDQYEYVMNYLAHIIQKPWKKTAVCLALHSKQGAGKGVILKKLENIIGDNHYSQNSNAERVFGKFNGLLEGKTLINLDEAFWGGDKKLEGQIKNHITEDKQTVEKKSINQYNIHDFCNYIITTNNDWFAGIEEGDRRYYCLELLNHFAGRSNDEKEAYFNKIRMVPTEAFAKVLYNRDISQYNPRKFKKTALAQEQVERNHNSPKVWWNSVMRDGGFEYDGNFIDWGKCLKVNTGGYSSKKYGMELTDKVTGDKTVVYDKEWIFKCYDTKNYDGRKFCNNTFWKEIQKNCLGKKLYREEKIQKKKQRRIYVFLPTLEEARQAWYEYQEYDYGYGNDNKIEDQYDFSDDSDDEW